MNILLVFQAQPGTAGRCQEVVLLEAPEAEFALKAERADKLGARLQPAAQHVATLRNTLRRQLTRRTMEASAAPVTGARWVHEQRTGGRKSNDRCKVR